MEINKVYVKTRADFGKQCVFDTIGPAIDVEISPDPPQMNDYLLKSYCHVGAQYSKQLALHEVQTLSKTSKNAGIFHYEGGWPKEINPRDEESTMRFRRRIEKDDHWAPKMRPLLQMMENSVLQNGAVNIYQHYFDDMIPMPLVQHLGIRTLNVYSDPEIPVRPVSNISWSPDSGHRIAVSYCFLKFGRLPDYSNRVYIWQIDNPNEPYMALEPFAPCVVCEFNSRDPSVLASGLMTGQVCNWDIRTGTSPVQSSHLQFSHREYTNGVRWVSSKSNTEFFSTSTDGRAMWWDTRWLQHPTEVIVFNLENLNEPDMDRAVGVSCLNFGPVVGTKFVFGMDNGVLLTGSKKAKTNMEKVSSRFPAHFGPVVSVDRNVFNPAVFLSVGDWTAKIWAEDTREGNLISTMFLTEYPTGACWNKLRHSVFYVITSCGRLLVWDLLQNLQYPIVTLQLCDESLTTLAPYDEGSFLAIGNSAGKVFLVESMNFLQSFHKKDRSLFSEYLDRCSKLTKAVDVRLREIKLSHRIIAEEQQQAAAAAASSKPRGRQKQRKKSQSQEKAKGREKEKKEKEKEKEKQKQKNKDKDKDDESKAGKDRRRSGAKEKKRGREDPEIIEAEQKYFEMVEKEFEKYEKEDDPDICPVRQVYSPSKKQDRKRKKSLQDAEDAEGTDKKEGKVKGRGRNSGKASIVKRKGTLKSSTMLEKSISKISESPSATSLTEAASKKLSSSTLTGSRDGKKKQKPRIKFFLPTPCKGEVCRPKVCCWRTSRRKKGRKRKPSEDSVAVMDHSSSLILSKGDRKSSSAFREMLRPPSELRYEVERAKREIREAVWSVDERRRFMAERKPKSRRPKQRQKRIIRRVRAARFKDSCSDDSMEASKDEVGAKMKEVTLDPCSPKKDKPIVDQLSAIIGIPVPQFAEEEVEGKDYSEQMKTTQATVYPRISEFQSLE